MGSFLLRGGMGFLIFKKKGSCFLPRGMWAKESNGLGGVEACCPEGCEGDWKRADFSMCLHGLNIGVV